MKQKNVIIVVVVLGIIFVGGVLAMNRKPVQNKVETGNTNTINNNATSDGMAEKKAIVDIAVANPDFSTLVTAVKAAGLAETLSGQGPFTLFAPTNEAFAKLPKATLDAVLQDKDKLTAILTYHVVSGNVMAKDVLNLTSAKTVQGQDLKITLDGSTVMVNDAPVVLQKKPVTFVREAGFFI